MTIALIDTDIVVFRSAAASENDSFNVACLRADDMMRKILNACDTDQYRAFLSGGDNFRYKIDPSYKANRKDKVDPRWRDDLKEFLVLEWGAEVTDGIEADDALGIYQSEDLRLTKGYYTGSEWGGLAPNWLQETDTVICSIDKDLLQIPGKHYNFVKDEFQEVSELQGLQWFYQQMLIGDTSDNIVGVKGIGKVKAAKAISCLEKEEEMYYTVRRLYKDDERFLRNGKLLHIMREENDIWNPSPTLSAYYDQQLQELGVKYETSEQLKHTSSESISAGISG